MNKLIIKNRPGETYDLLNSTVATFQLDGLGLTDQSTYVRAGSEYLRTTEATEQRSIKFTALFYDNADVEYKRFIIFMRKPPLTLVYENGSGEYEVKCNLRDVSRIDRKGYDIYSCAISLLCLGDFHEKISEYNSGEAGEQLTYSYTYPYTYGSGVTESVDIVCDTSELSPCKIMIYGPCTDPAWRHYVNGELYATGSMSGSISDGGILVIDCTSIPYTITEQDGLGNLISDRYQACDFGTERFFFLQKGRNTITVTHQNSGVCALKVEANISYASI